MSGFNKIEKTASIFRLLSSIDWTWRAGDDAFWAKQHLWAIKSEFPLQEGGVARRTYEIDGGLTISFYFDATAIKSVESNLMVSFFDYDEIGPDGWDKMTAHYIAVLAGLAVDVACPCREEVECGWAHDDVIKGYVWSVGDAALVLALKNEDANLPFRICFRVFPEPSGRRP